MNTTKTPSTLDVLSDIKHPEEAPILYSDIMIDIETLGTRVDCAIIGIAAVMFDLRTGSMGPTFAIDINVKSNLAAKRNVNLDTLSWWIDDNGTQFAEWAVSDKSDLKDALLAFIYFIQNNTRDLKSFAVWGNSNRFDLGILEHAIHSLHLDIPWHFRGERDVRTLSSILPEIKIAWIKRAKEEKWALHDPVVDCRLQIEYCTEIYNRLKPEPVEIDDPNG